MEENTVLGLLHKQLEEEKVAAQEAVLSRAAKDFAEYSFLCGKLNGLAMAQVLLHEMVTRLRKQEE